MRPAPGEPGWRLDEGSISEILREYLTYFYRAAGDWPDNTKSYSEEDAGPHLHYRRCKRVRDLLGLDMVAPCDLPGHPG
jgi:hypothetical protein